MEDNEFIIELFGKKYFNPVWKSKRMLEIEDNKSRCFACKARFAKFDKRYYDLEKSDWGNYEEIFYCEYCSKSQYCLYPSLVRRTTEELKYDEAFKQEQIKKIITLNTLLQSQLKKNVPINIDMCYEYNNLKNKYER